MGRGVLLRRASLEKHLMATSIDGLSQIDTKTEKNCIEWITLFRRNWHIYADMVLKIKLKPFQLIMLYLMGVSDVFFAMCSRGLGKTFIVGLAAVIRMLLYPYSEVVITASTVPQANIIVENKIRDEIIKKLSPYLLWFYDHEYLIIQRQDDGYKIECTLNGSTLRVLPCLPSSRGHRSTFTIYEECRLMKKTLLDSVFDKMAHPRQAKYLENPIYTNDTRWLEESKTIYITSARYNYEWYYTEFKKCVKGMYLDKNIAYNVFAGDIFMSIENGLKTWGDYRRARKMSAESDFRMEDLNEVYGESENAFFTIKSFRDNQIIKSGFRPPTPIQLYMGEDLGNVPKKDNEIRLVVMDLAFANTTNYKNKNDNTFIMCMSLIWKKNRFERRVDYCEQFEAGDSLGAGRRARILRSLYDADYLVNDQRSGGESIYNSMTEPLPENEYENFVDSRGLTVSNENDLHVVPLAKLDDLRHRTVDKEAIPCIIPFIATPELMSTAWVSLKRQLESNNIKFLLTTQDEQTELEDSGEYFKMSSEELAEALLPYAETEELVKEAVSLSTEIKNNYIALKEPRTGTKDRIVVLCYANFIAERIENQWNRYSVSNETYDDVQLVY